MMAAETQPARARPAYAEPVKPRTLFGIPVSGFGFFASVLISFTLCALSFFLTTFLSIAGVSIYKGITHSSITLAISYKYIAAPFAVLVLIVALPYFLYLWWLGKKS